MDRLHLWTLIEAIQNCRGTEITAIPTVYLDTGVAVKNLVSMGNRIPR